MLFKSLVYAQASGSVGGLTYSHNAAGMYARARTTPVNPNTAAQQNIRSILSSLSARWQDVLTAAQRSAWEVFASNMPRTNRVGDSIILSGVATFVRANAARLQAALAVVDDAPTVFVSPTFTVSSVSFSESADTCIVSFNNAEDWANEDDAAMLAYVSRPVAPTINYFKGPYQYAGLVAGDSVTPPTTPHAFALPFPCELGQKLFARLLVLRADGRVSADFRSGSLAV